MEKAKAALILFIAFCVCTISCKKEKDSKVDCNTLSAAYTANVKPIIVGNCLSSGCHNAGSTNGDFNTYAGLKTSADNGSLNKKVVQDKSMPPTGSLSQDDRNKIQCWVSAGAPNN